MKITGFLAALAVAVFACTSVVAQTSGGATNHAFVIGKGPGTTGYTSLLCTSAQLAIGQAAADPICKTITGDVTVSAAGVTAIGSTIVHSSMLNADVFSTAHSWTATQSFPNNSLTLAEFPTIAANTVIGSVVGGTPAALTQAQLTALCNTFTTALNGCVPAPGSSTGKVLSDSGTWITSGSGGISGTSSVSGASTTYTSAQNNVLVERSNSSAAMSDTLPGTSPGVLPANTVITVTNNDAAGLLAIAAGSGAAIKGTSLLFNGFIYAGPGQTLQLFSDGSNYWVVGAPNRAKLTVNTSISIATTGSDTTGNGITTAFATTNKAWSFAQNILDLNSFVLTLQHAAGTYSQTILLSGEMVGQNGAASVLVQGNTVTPSGIIFSGTGGSLSSLTAEMGAKFQLQGVTLTSASAQALVITNGSVVNFQSNNVGAVANAAITAVSGGTLRIIGNYTINGNEGVHWNANNGGHINLEAASVTITLSGSLTFTTFVVAQTGGTIFFDFSPITFSGTCSTGTKWSAVLNGVINGNSTTFPCPTGGATATGGQFN